MGQRSLITLVFEIAHMPMLLCDMGHATQCLETFSIQLEEALVA